MTTRNVTDSEGNIIGQLTLPDDTTEEQWQAALAQYQKTGALTEDEIIACKVSMAIRFGNKMVIDAAVERIKMGIVEAGKVKAVAEYCFYIQMYLMTGALHAVIDEIDLKLAQGVPEDLAPFVTADILNAHRAKIVEYLSGS